MKARSCWLAIAAGLVAGGCSVPEPVAKPAPVPPPPPVSQAVAPDAPPAAPPKPAQATTSPAPPAEAAKPVQPTPTPPKTAQAPAAAPKPAAPPKAPAPAASRPPPAAAPARAPLDLRSLEQRLRDTSAIGLLTKLSLKNQVDDLITRFRTFHAGQRPPTLAELRPAFELLLMKALSLLQDKDAQLARDIDASRDAIWGVLTDREKLAQYL